MFHNSLLNETRSRKQCGHTCLLSDKLLTTMLDELGVESIDDLTLMEERDLVKYLKPIQSWKLMKGIKDGKFILSPITLVALSCH